MSWEAALASIDWPIWLRVVLLPLWAIYVLVVTLAFCVYVDWNMGKWIDRELAKQRTLDEFGVDVVEDSP
jgi:hypothetical protein